MFCIYEIVFVRIRETEGRSQKVGVRRQESEGRSQKKSLTIGSLVFCLLNSKLKTQNSALKTHLNTKRELRTRIGFGDLNAGLEGFAEVGHVGDGENAGEIGGDRVDGGN